MRSAASYAKVLPRLRVLLSKLTPEERLREISSTASLGDALQELRDTQYAAVSEARRLSDALQAMYSVYASVVDTIARNSPPAAREAAFAFVREDMLRDTMAVLASTMGGTYIELRTLVTYTLEYSPLRILAQDPESITSPQRLVEVLSGEKWLRGYLEKALDIVQQVRDERAVDTAVSAGVVDLYSRAIAMLEGYGRRVAERVLCPRLKYISAATAVEASLQGLPPRIMSAARPEIDVCDYWTKAASAYEREQTPESLLSYIRQYSPELGFDGKTPVEALRNASRVARERVRDAAMRAYMGYPLHGGLVVAALSLARLEYESISSLVSATALRLHPDEYYRDLVIAPR